MERAKADKKNYHHLVRPKTKSKRRNSQKKVGEPESAPPPRISEGKGIKVKDLIRNNSD